MLGEFLFKIKAWHVGVAYFFAVMAAAVQSVTTAGWLLVLGGALLLIYPPMQVAREWYHLIYYPRTAGWDEEKHVFKLISIEKYSLASRVADADNLQREFREFSKELVTVVAVGTVLFFGGGVIANEPIVLQLAGEPVFASQIVGVVTLWGSVVSASFLMGVAILGAELALLFRVNTDIVDEMNLG